MGKWVVVHLNAGMGICGREGYAVYVYCISAFPFQEQRIAVCKLGGRVGGEVWVIVCEEDALHTRTLWWPRVHTTTSLTKQDNKM